MQVDTSVAEADIGKLKADMEATFTVDAFPAKTFKGKVRQIRNAPQTQQNVVTYDAVIDVSNSGLELRPGMTANVTFIFDHRDSALRVANAALRFQPPPELARRPGRRRRRARRRPARRRQRGRRAAARRAAAARAAAARRPIGGRSGCCADRRRRRCACARASATAPTRRSRRPSSTRATGVVTDAEVPVGDDKRSPAGGGAFRRMF